MDEAKSDKISEFLTGGYITHDTLLMLDVARALWLNVTEGVPEKICDLFMTCQFGACERPSLPYMPNKESGLMGGAAFPQTVQD